VIPRVAQRPVRDGFHTRRLLVLDAKGTERT
jgi:hypothetical protein